MTFAVKPNSLEKSIISRLSIILLQSFPVLRYPEPPPGNQLFVSKLGIKFSVAGRQFFGTLVDDFRFLRSHHFNKNPRRLNAESMNGYN